MKILNAKGEPILLNEKENRVAAILQRQVNALGYEIQITTLTTIMKKVSEQKFFKISPADYIPVRVGQGAWSSALTTYLSYALGDDFGTGVLNTGSNNGRLASADAGVNSITVPVRNWAKAIGWTIIDLEQAAKSGNWDLVTSKEIARKTNWDLGIQKVAFLGMSGDSSVLGLLNQSGITLNLTRITKAISSMTTAELKVFTAGIVNDYRANNNRTAFPTTFVMPESDYLGLSSQASADFPIRSTLDLLLETFKVTCMNPNFKILPCAYGDASYNAGSLSGYASGAQRYALLNYDDASLRMDIPVDYTNTLANSLDNFSFQNVGYGQFTGVMAYRPLELMYFQYTA